MTTSGRTHPAFASTACALHREVKPSFLLFAVNASTITVFVYEVVDGERKVTQTEFKKPSN